MTKPKGATNKKKSAATHMERWELSRATYDLARKLVDEYAPDDLEKLDPVDRMRLMTQLLGFHLAKMKAVEHTGEVGVNSVDLSALSAEQLKKLANKL